MNSFIYRGTSFETSYLFDSPKQSEGLQQQRTSIVDIYFEVVHRFPYQF